MQMSERHKNNKNGNEDEITVSSVEDGFKELDEIVSSLNTDDISLEESFSKYEKGMKILKEINDKIDRVEKKVKILNGENADEFQ